MAEKTLQDMPRKVREYFDKGSQALQHGNFDYAISIFNSILQEEPAFYDCREFLRAAQYKKAGAKSGLFKKMFTSASTSPLLAKAQLALRKDPREALVLAEQILNVDPPNAPAHRIIAEAALAADLPQTAILSLEILVKNSPRDKTLRAQLAMALARSGEVGRAESIYAELSREFPQDAEIAQAHKNMAASKSLAEGGFDAVSGGKGSFRDLIRDKEQALTLEQEQQSVKSEDVSARLIAEYETRRANEPDNLRLLGSLAKLYTEKNQFEKALELYQQIKIRSGNDPTIERAIAETTARQFDFRLSQLDPEAPDHAEQVERLKAGKEEYRINECKARVDKYPTDLALRFELGKMYFDADKISEAIQEFQKARANPHKRTQAQSYLGQCFARRGMNDLAARTLQAAISEKEVFDEEKKELLYALATVLEKMAKPEEAMEQYKLIYETDSGYRDVAAKVEAYYAGQ